MMIVKLDNFLLSRLRYLEYKLLESIKLEIKVD